jgi:selenide,water dikinase
MDHAAIRYLPGAVEAAREGFLPGGLKNNRDFVAECAGFSENVAQEHRNLLFDPQTSGGLLIAISPESAEAAIAALERHGVSARRIGRVVAKKTPLLFVQ